MGVFRNRLYPRFWLFPFLVLVIFLINDGEYHDAILFLICLPLCISFYPDFKVDELGKLLIRRFIRWRFVNWDSLRVIYAGPFPGQMKLLAIVERYHIPNLLVIHVLIDRNKELVDIIESHIGRNRLRS